MSNYESTIISNDRNDNNKRQSDCIITFGNGMSLYKMLDANPKSMQNLIRNFYHWMDDERVKWINDKMDPSQLFPALIYWIKRDEEERDYSWVRNNDNTDNSFRVRHATDDEWRKNHNMKNFMTVENDPEPTNVQYIYRINPDTQMMEIFTGVWDSDALKFVSHESIGTVPVGQNYDATERVEM